MKRAKTLQHFNLILNYAWDPLGIICMHVQPPTTRLLTDVDEYSLYAEWCFDLLHESVDISAVAEYLVCCESQWMEVEPNGSTAYRTARLLAAAYKEFYYDKLE